MYTIQNEETFNFSMLNLETNETIYFHGLDELLRFLMQKQQCSFIFYDERYYNPYLDGFNATGHDLMVVSKYNVCTKMVDYSMVLRPYRFFDKYGHVYDVRIHHKTLIKMKKEYWADRRLAKMPNYTFRRGPVPGTSVHYRGHFLRHMKTTNEIRQNSIPEYKAFVRNSRNPANLVSVYDDIPVLREKCWKSHTKERHQWAKHLKGSKVPDKYALNDFFNLDDVDIDET